VETGGGGGGGGTGGGGVPAPDVSIDPPAEVIFRGDGGVEVDVAWIADPTATAANFLGVAVYLEDPDISSGANHPLDGLSMPLDGSAQVSGDQAPVFVNDSAASPAVIFPDSAMGGTSGKSYKTARNIRIYLAAYGPYSHPRLVRATDPNPTPNILVEIPVGRDSGESGMEWAFLVTNVQVEVTTDFNRLDPQYYLTFKYTPPDPTRPVPPGVNHFGGCRIVFVYEDNAGNPIFPGTDTGLNVPVAQSETGFKSPYYKPGAAGQYRCYFVSEDDSQPLGAHMNSLVEGTTPYALAVITAVPGTPDVTNFSISGQQTKWLADGSMIAEATFAWALPDHSAENVRYSGVVLYLVGVTGATPPLTPFPQVLTPQLGNIDDNFLMDISDVPTYPEDWIIAAISIDNNGHLADDPKQYSQPSFHSPTVSWNIGPPTPGSLGSGKEFAPLVTLGSGASASATQSLSSDGVGMVSFSVGPWINPDDNQFGNAQVAMVINRDWSKPTLWSVPANATSFVTPTMPSFGNLGASVPVDFYLLSDDPQGNKNHLVPGVTPLIGSTYVPASGAIIPARSGWFDEDQFSWVTGSGLTADNIEAKNIYVGQTLVVGGAPDTSFAGQHNGQIAVKNSSGVLRAWMGEQQPGQGMTPGVAPLWGGWFGQLWVGGNSPLDAPLWIDPDGIIQVGGIKALGGRYPYLSVRDQTGLEMGRIGAQINTQTALPGDNVGTSPPGITAGAWFTQLAVGGQNLSNWNILITPDPDPTNPLGSIFQMRNIHHLTVDYAFHTGPPSNPHYIMEFGSNVWSAGTGTSQWQFPGIRIYEVDSNLSLFGAVYLNRGMVLRGPQQQNGPQGLIQYPVLASLVMYNGTASGSDVPGSFWGELTMYSPVYPFRPTVSISSGNAANGSGQMYLLDENGNLLFQVSAGGQAYFKGPLQGPPTPVTGAQTPVNAYAVNVGGSPVIDSTGAWVGKPIPPPPAPPLTPWTSNIGGGGFALSNVSSISAGQYDVGAATVINANKVFVGPGVDVGVGNHVYASYIATNQYGAPGNAVGWNQIDTGTINASGTITCNLLNANTYSVVTFSPGTIAATGDISCNILRPANGMTTTGGVTCGSVTVSNGPIACGSFAAVHEVNCESVQIHGTTRIDQFGIYRGSFQTDDHCYASDFGIYAVCVGWPQRAASGNNDGLGAGPAHGTGANQYSSFRTGDGRTVYVNGGIIVQVI
jgi:hypothetical protein